MANENENSILFDWLSFTSKIDSIESISRLLGLPGDIKFEQTYGFYGYHDRLAYDGLNIHYNPHHEDMGVLVEMSGNGCRVFDECSCTNFMSLFNVLIADQESYNITRLDVAYDDFNSVLPVRKIIKDIHKFNFVSKFKSRSFIIEEHAGHVGQTCYFGSTKSAVIFRLYDKAFERGRDDEEGFSWYRFEMQLRGDRALTFVSDLCDGESVGHLFFGVINNYLRFVTPQFNDSNKKRWKMRSYWLDFLQHVDKISIYSKKDTEYNLAKCEHYVHQQCSNSVEALINSKGVIKFLSDMVHDKPVYTQKYQNISDNKGEISRFIVDSMSKYDHTGIVDKYSYLHDNGGDILSFLHDRGECI